MILTKKIIDSTRTLKGGYSTAILTRLGVSMPPTKEHKLHNIFDHCRTPSREWFNWNNNIKRFILTNCNRENWSNLKKFLLAIPQKN